MYLLSTPPPLGFYFPIDFALPYYPGNVWAVDMKLEEGGSMILHKDGAIYNSVTGWVITTPPYYPGSNYAVDLEVR